LDVLRNWDGKIFDQKKMKRKKVGRDASVIGFGNCVVQVIEYARTRCKFQVCCIREWQKIAKYNWTITYIVTFKFMSVVFSFTNQPRT